MYVNDLALTVLGGTLPSTVTVRLWEVADSLNPSTDKIETRADEAPVAQTVSTAVPSDPGNPITRHLRISLNATVPPAAPLTGALTLHPSDGFPPADLFRSGRFDEIAASPSEPLEVVLFDPVLIGRTELLEGLPQPPIDFHEQVVKLPGISVTVFATVTELSATLSADSTIAISAGGTMRPGRAAALVDFAFAAKLAVDGSGDALKPEDVLSVSFLPGSANLSFSSHGSVASDMEQALMNLLSGVITGQVAPKILDIIHQAVNRQALQSAATAANGGQSVPATLPAGVVLSVAAVHIHPPGGPVEGVSVLASLGAFGGVLSKFPQPPASSGGSSNCALSSMAALPSAEIDLPRLRAMRDRLLAGGPWERDLVAAYYRHSAEVWVLLQRDERLLATAQALVEDLQAGRWGLRDALRAGRLARRLRRAGSPSLAQDVEKALAKRLAPRLRGAGSILCAGP